MPVSPDVLRLEALLRELAAEAYNRNISRYGILVDISDELVDAVSFDARVRITDKWLASG